MHEFSPKSLMTQSLSFPLTEGEPVQSAVVFDVVSCIGTTQQSTYQLKQIARVWPSACPLTLDADCYLHQQLSR